MEQRFFIVPSSGEVLDVTKIVSVKDWGNGTLGVRFYRHVADYLADGYQYEVTITKEDYNLLETKCVVVMIKSAFQEIAKKR